MSTRLVKPEQSNLLDIIDYISNSNAPERPEAQKRKVGGGTEIMTEMSKKVYRLHILYLEEFTQTIGCTYNILQYCPRFSNIIYRSTPWWATDPPGQTLRGQQPGLVLTVSPDNNPLVVITGLSLTLLLANIRPGLSAHWSRLRHLWSVYASHHEIKWQK